MPDLRRLPVRRTIPLPASGFAAASRVALRFINRGEPGCGVLHDRHQFGGSVPEGYRSVMFVLLKDALVEAEEYDDTPSANTFVEIHAETESRADEVEAVIRQGKQ